MGVGADVVVDGAGVVAPMVGGHGGEQESGRVVGQTMDPQVQLV